MGTKQTIQTRVKQEVRLMSSKGKLEFYTLPPIPHPFILINAYRPKVAYALRFKPFIRKIILDSGIEIFRDDKVKDYPPYHLEKIVVLHNKLRRLFPEAEVKATVPDYCDDYHPKSLWLSEEVTNIERTVQNVIHAVEKYPHVNWLIPIQGWNRQPESVERCIKQLKDNDLLGFDYYAIGNLCVERDTKIITKAVKNARKLLPEKRLHIFGLKLRDVPKVYPFVNSFDSLAWTRPVDKTLRVLRDGHYVGWSCKTSEERIKFFKAWLDHLNYYLSQSYLM
jgi:hypothetical protein